MSIYSDSPIEHISEIFKALSNPHRLRILMRLATCGEQSENSCSNGMICACAGVLVNELGLAQSTVSHHLKELSRCGLITMVKNGQSVRCHINTATIQMLIEFLENRKGA